MKNISSYFILGLLVAFKAYAFDGLSEADATNVAFSSLRPDITANNPSITGFSTFSGTGLDVTYNDRAELSKPVSKTDDADLFVQSKHTETPKIREATIDEPVVVNDWALTIGESVKSPIPEAVIDAAIKEDKEQKEKIKAQEIVFKENNLSSEAPVAFSEESYDIPETISTFALNNIVEDNEDTALAPDEMEEGIGLVSAPTLKIKEVEAGEIKEKSPNYEEKSLKNRGKNSPWAVATVRGKSSNRLASIGSIEDISKYSKSTKIDAFNESDSANPWSKNSNATNSLNNQPESKIFNASSASKETTFTPDARVNQWAIRGFETTEPSNKGLVDTNFIRESGNSFEKPDYDDRWINEQKAVLINSISSKPLAKTNTNTDLKSDEKLEKYAQVSRNQRGNEPKKLLTKIEDEEEDFKSENYSASDYSSNYEDSSEMPSIKSYPPTNLGSHITLGEIRLNFKPNYSDLSLPSMRLVSNFASRVASNTKSIIEIRLSDKSPYLQSNRLTIVRQILNTNGISDDRIKPISTDRNPDTMILKFIPIFEKEDTIVREKTGGEIKKW